MKVAVVTPTIGADTLLQCIESVQKQTYKDFVHYIFIDGRQHSAAAAAVLEKVKNDSIKIITLEENIGEGWYGHRVYSACSFLVNSDAICYLDEDNWFEPNHLETQAKNLSRGFAWSYSLRKIFNGKGEYLCEDNCESLGKWPIYFNDKEHHIDTSSYMVKRDIALKIGHAWYGQWGADRKFFKTLKQYYPNFGCTNQYSLCYRLDGNPNSVNHDFFKKGNSDNTLKYPEGFPWRITQSTQSKLVGPGITITGL